MNDTLPKMHVCKNCGFMSTRRNLFEMVEGLLLCVFCIDQYTEFLFDWKQPTRPV
jgi:hypothetical protein